MAFPGHSRSLALTCTPLANDNIENIHPDRHRRIDLGHSSPRDTNGSASTRSKQFARSNEFGEDHLDSRHDNDTLSRRDSRRDSIAMITDDVGNPPTPSLWVGNVPTSLTNDQLWKVFSKYGHILSVRATPFKRFGFVNFNEVDDAITAWYDCHERDIFGTGLAVYVRYEMPPDWLREKQTSLKRKRSSNDAFNSLAHDLKRPIPTGPKSQVSQSASQNGYRSQHANISPPPLRRRSMYRCHDDSEDDRGRYRPYETYRPSYYSDEHSDDRSDTGSSNRNSNDSIPIASTKEKVPTNSHRDDSAQPSATSGSKSVSNKPSLVDAASGSLGAHDAASSGMEIKGLAASQKALSNSTRESRDERHSGLQIKGVANSTKTVDTQDRAESTIRGTSSSQKSGSVETAARTSLSAAALNEKSARSDSTHCVVSEEQLILRTEHSKAYPPSVDLTSSHEKSLGEHQNTEQHDVSQIVSSSTATDKTADNPLKTREKLGFAHLSHLFEEKEKAESIANKARTISPFGRVRASSRDTASVKSAKTDPTPLAKPISSSSEKCEICMEPRKNFKLFTCSVANCSKRVHSICGDISISTSGTGPQKSIFKCIECSDQDELLKAKMAKGPKEGATRVEKPHTRNDSVSSACCEPPPTARLDHSDDDTSDLTRNRKVVPMHVLTADSRFTDHDHSILQNLQDEITDITQAISGTESRLNKDTAETVIPNDKQKAVEPTVAQSRKIPPKQPRSMRDEDSNASRKIAARYKKEVTCPWWQKGNSCDNRPEDCMFAHRWTGIESPNGRSVAKAWTCYNFGTPHGCQHTESECLYSHTDTGLYIGLDGKASKKHLECYWWRIHRRCKFSDTACQCAHFPTGLVAKEPRPKDTFRRGNSSTSVSATYEAGSTQEVRTRSPSYSPSLPPSPPPTMDGASNSEHSAVPQSSSRRLPSPVVQNNAGGDNPLIAPQAVDPRRRRTLHSTSAQEQVESAFPNGQVGQGGNVSTPVRAIEVKNRTSAVETDFQEPTQRRQSTTQSCKHCSKRVFKADICTDCLKSVQRRPSEQENVADQNFDREDAVIVPSESRTTATSFAIPPPKVLKRTRSGSSSNLFATKRVRPNITLSSTSSSDLLNTSNLAKVPQPMTLEQLNRHNAQQKAKDALQDPSAPQSLQKVIDAKSTEMPRAPMQRTISRTSTSSQVSIVESPVNMLQNFSKVTQSKHHDSNRENDQQQQVGELGEVEGVREANTVIQRVQSPSAGSGSSDDDYEHDEEDESDEDRINEESNTDDDSDTPLAELRGREDKLFWSSSTSVQSPEVVHTSSMTVAIPPRSVVQKAPVSGSSNLRCRLCIHQHRKCVHDIKGMYDARKCSEWYRRIKQQEQENLKDGTRSKPLKCHYNEAQRQEIRDIAEAYDASQESDEDFASSKPAKNNVRVPPHKVTTVPDASIHENGATRIEAHAISIADEEISSSPLSQSPGPKGLTSVGGALSPRLSTSKLRGQNATIMHHQSTELIDTISRLKARGVAFEESDDEDDEEEDRGQQAIHDKRIDPLLDHKRQCHPAIFNLKLPKITKGQGLKNPNLIHQRQMSRNLQLFGDRHKEVNRCIPQQEVTAMVQKKDSDDVLALTEESMERMAFQEFLGLREGTEIEACLGKVALPRGKATMELAFRERETGPELGIWGREKRGIRKEKPVFVLSL